MAPRLEVICDESGSEGENLVRTDAPVFVHASTTVSLPEARRLVNQIKGRVGVRNSELKARVLLRSNRRDDLVWFLREGIPQGSARVHISDKRYFAVGKIIDLLVEEVVHARGGDLYSGGQARSMAQELFLEAEQVFGADVWGSFLSDFVSLMRYNQDSGIRVTVDEFYGQAKVLRNRSVGTTLEPIMGELVESRTHMESFRRMVINPRLSAALDPLLAGIAQLARSWFEQEKRPIVLIHDEQSVFTPARIESLLLGLRDPSPEFRAFVSPVQVMEFRQVDSKLDARVQVADCLAGASRAIAQDALFGRPDEELCSILREMVDPHSLWGDETSWRLLGPSSS